MCEMCRGWTAEEVAADQRHHIATIGWTVLMIEPRPGGVGWAYTIGLSESYGHPELLCFSCDVRSAWAMLNRLGARVRDGTVVQPGRDVLAEVTTDVVDVHPVHLFGELVNGWRALYADRVPAQRPELRVLQVLEVAQVCHRCGDRHEDRGLRIRLDRPYARLPRP